MKARWGVSLCYGSDSGILCVGGGDIVVLLCVCVGGGGCVTMLVLSHCTPNTTLRKKEVKEERGNVMKTGG